VTTGRTALHNDYYDTPPTCRFTTRQPDYLHLRFDDRLIPVARRREIDISAVRKWINQDWASVQLCAEVGRTKRRMESD
jgi:hypothetical protein